MLDWLDIDGWVGDRQPGIFEYFFFVAFLGAVLSVLVLGLRRRARRARWLRSKGFDPDFPEGVDDRSELPVDRR